MGIFQKGKKNSKYSYLDEKLRMLDEDMKKTGLISSSDVSEGSVEIPKITLPKNPSKDDIKMVSEYLDTHSKSNWRNEYRLENNERTNQERIEEEISKLRLQRKPRKNANYVTEGELKKKKIIKEEVTFEDKVNKILQIYNEGLLNIPPSEDTPDPLTPTDGNFVTFSQLNDHYNLFINRIQQQLSTLGGGGEVRLQYMDDIVGIATNASVYDGKYLKYNDTLGKFEFSEVTSGLSTETQNLQNVLDLGNTSTTGINIVGVITALGFVGDGSNLTGLGTFSGDYNSLTNTPTIPSDTGDLTNNVGFVTASIVDGYSTTSYVDNAVAGIVSAAPATLDTLNELAQALGDDPNFATTTTTLIGTKAPLSGANFTGVVTATSFVGPLTGTASFATNAGVATYATSAGIATIATTATYATSAGIATTATSAGTATTSTYSDYVYVDESEDDNANYNIVFLEPLLGGDAYRQLQVDNAGITFNPGLNELRVQTVYATGGTGFRGNGSNITGIVTTIVAGTGVTISQVSGTVTINSTASGSGISTTDILNVAGVNATGVVTATSFDGDLTGNADTSTNASRISIASGGNSVQYPLFAQAYGASSQNRVYNDQHLQYNQVTNTLILDNITASGVITATDFNSSSDIALKENVEVIDNPLDKLTELRGVTFDWKSSKKSGVGVVAQDVERVLPQAVGGSQDQKTVNYNAIIGLLVESVKQQQKEIEELRKRLS